MQNHVQPIPPQPQILQVPGQSGVNIQIFNPTVGTPGSNYNVNSPSYNMGGGYPQGYYTNNWGQNTANGCTCGCGTNTSTGVNGAGSTTNPSTANTADGANSANSNATATNNSAENSNNTTTTNVNETKTTTESKKTEKRKVVELTDDYIKTLENYLNSQDTEVRLMGAKELIARFEEDKTRKDDKALNALVNKIIQDPSTKIRTLGLGLLESRTATGDETSVQILQNMQKSDTGYGQDARQATEILLKMAGKTVEKEFEVTDNKKKEEKK